MTRHADVVHVSRNPDLFCSGQGVGLGEVPIDLLELNASFLVMDAPRHTALTAGREWSLYAEEGGAARRPDWTRGRSDSR